MPSAHRRSPTGPALLVLVAAISQEVGAAFAVGLFAALGAIGAVFIRFLVAGVVLCLAVRPRVRGLPRRAWVSAGALAATLTVMNLCFYNSLTRIPLGVAVTVEVLGPLILSVGRRQTEDGMALGRARAGGGGVAQPDRRSPRPCRSCRGWLSPPRRRPAGRPTSWPPQRAAADFPSVDAVALATAIGAVVTAPFAVFAVDPGRALHWGVLGVGATVGVMSSVIPYSLELISPAPPPAGDVRDLDLSVTGDRRDRGFADPAPASCDDRVSRDRRSPRPPASGRCAPHT